MSVAEIAFRGRQEVAKAFDRIGPSESGGPGAWLDAHAPALARPDTALRIVREEAPHRFFAGATEHQVAIGPVVEAAERLLAHRFDLLGYHGLWFGDPIDWHFDPVWKRRSPLMHWSRIDPLDAAVVGDSKVVWELNRHQWLVRLAQAWTMTGDDRYAAACVNAIVSWQRANPYGVGINWASSLEVAFRVMSWSWVLLLIRNAPAATPEMVAATVAGIGQHAAHIARFLSRYSSPNTHLTGEALGLLYAGTLFPEYRDASEWRRAAVRVLVDECARQVHPDGVHAEQATCYQRYTADIYLQFLLLAQRNVIAVPAAIAESTERMVDVLLTLRRPDGSLPDIADGDGGELLPLVERRPDDARGLFAVAAARFARPDFAWAAEGVAPEVPWLLGQRGVAAFEALSPAPPPGDGSRVLPDGGYVVMRSGWGSDAHQMIVDVGALGCPISSGHGHADLLSVQATVFGEPCLVDAGTYGYTAEPRWRDFFRGTAAHSTVRIDGVDQASPAGPFRWRQRPGARLSSWESTAVLDVVDAEHDGYERLADPVRCRRRVVFVKPHGWLVIDELSGATEHDVEVTFQCGPDIRIDHGPDSWLRARTPGGRALWLRAWASSPVVTEVRCGEQDPICGWTSADYGQRQPAPAVVLTARPALPWRVVTALVPADCVSDLAPPVQVHGVHEGPAHASFGMSGPSVRIDAHAIVLT